MTTSVRRRPILSATGPSTSVPTAPATSISLSSRVPPRPRYPRSRRPRAERMSAARTRRRCGARLPRPAGSSPERRPLPPPRSARRTAGRAAGAPRPRRSTTTTTTTGNIATSPPVRPSQSTSGVTTIGPSAYPVLPPMLKYDMPEARFRPLAYAANLAPPGGRRRSRSPRGTRARARARTSVRPQRAQSRRPPARFRPAAATPRRVDPTRDRRAAARTRTTRAPRASVPPWPYGSGRTRARRTAGAPERHRREVDRQMAARERRHRLAVELVAHTGEATAGAASPATMACQVDLQRLDHVSINVRDRTAAIAWYRDTLGLEQRDEPTEASSPSSWARSALASRSSSPGSTRRRGRRMHVRRPSRRVRPRPRASGSAQPPDRHGCLVPAGGPPSALDLPPRQEHDRADDVRALRRRGFLRRATPTDH